MNHMGKTVISDYYTGKTILITGATGFLGKVLIWKLLQSCSSLDTIFILLRPKRGKNKDLRMTELFQVPIFDNFKKEYPHIFDKIKVIVGDIGKDNLGISEEDERVLIDSVHIIFHTAATVNFDADLRDAVNLNVQGTQRLLELATKMHKLEVFVHTSTAYCCCDVAELEEKTYKAKKSPQQIIDLFRRIKPEVLKSMSNELVKPHPNTYTYSKRLAENLVVDYHPRLPVVIVRPTLVTPALNEPIPGWVDNINGVVGLIVAAWKGILRVVWRHRDSDRVELIPVDIVCNNLITVGWKTAKNRLSNRTISEDVPVYNLGGEGKWLLGYEDIFDFDKKLRHIYPFSSTLWYPNTIICISNFYVYIVLTAFLQWIPALLIDTLLPVFGYNRIMIRIQRKLYRGIKIFHELSRHKWNFVKSNILDVRNELTDEDRHTFRLIADDNEVDEEKYSSDWVKVVRWYLMKEDPSNLPAARRRIKILYFLHCLVKFVFWLIVLRILYWQVAEMVNPSQ